MAWAEQFVAQYGYAALFMLLMLGIVGPLIPDETILVIAGIFIRRHTMHPVLAMASAYAGSVCGITLSYTLGRYGAKWLTRYSKQLCRTHVWFERYGGWTLFFGYFVMGVRHFTALVAGTAKMNRAHFAAYAYSGGLVWVIVFLSIGYFIGDGWERWARYIHGGFLIGAVLAAVACITAYKMRHRY